MIDDGSTLSPSLSSPDRDLERLYAAALENLLTTNTVRSSTAGGTGVFRAGGGYPQPWTRDAAINCWNAGSLLRPDTARATLLDSLQAAPGDATRLLIRQDDQWWDQIIWVLGAWHHVLVTGDRDFALLASQVGHESLTALEQHFDAELGVFRGGAVMQDGIAGYPEPPFDPRIGSTFVNDHPRSADIACLSTNAVYYEAMRTLDRLATIVGAPHVLATRARMLRRAIIRTFWLEDRRHFGFMHIDGETQPYRETLGDAFAILFGIADDRQASSTIASHPRLPYGSVNVWPHFDRFDDAHPGRHNAICWPMVMGFWASAAAKIGNTDEFVTEFRALSALVAGSEGAFFEVYDGQTGAVEGGWQNGRQWPSEPDQTWSASAFLRLVHEQLVGLVCDEYGVRFSPVDHPDLPSVRVRDLRYRSAVLDISVERGADTETMSINGVERRRIDGLRLPSDVHGEHRVEIRLPA